jgi:hypothetical protein
MSEVADIATRLAILDRGTLRIHTTPDRLLGMARGRVWEGIVPEAELARLRERLTLSGVVRRLDGVHIRIVSAEPPFPGAGAAEPTLEDAYLALVHGVLERPQVLNRS